MVILRGDFIDRGPQIGPAIVIVRSMVENDRALPVLGNQEWNTLEPPHSTGAGSTPLQTDEGDTLFTRY
jgi:hypothetical protein